MSFPVSNEKKKEACYVRRTQRRETKERKEKKTKNNI